jgi:hypothetical protein
MYHFVYVVSLDAGRRDKGRKWADNSIRERRSFGHYFMFIFYVGSVHRETQSIFCCRNR